MNRNWLNFLIDGLTALVVLWLIYTGLLMYFILPPGSGHRGMTLLGLDRHGWGDVHFWTSVAVLALVLVHVALHWSWVCTMVNRMLHRGGRGPGSRLRRNLIGVATILLLAGVMAGGLLLARAAIEQGDQRPRRQQRGRLHGDAAQPNPNLRLTPRSNTPAGSHRLILGTHRASPPTR